MFAMYASGWPSSLKDLADERDRAERMALEEARIASDWQAARHPAVTSAGLIERVRRVLGAAPAQPACATCAA